MSGLVENPEDRFSQNEAHLTTNSKKKYVFPATKTGNGDWRRVYCDIHQCDSGDVQSSGVISGPGVLTGRRPSHGRETL